MAAGSPVSLFGLLRGAFRSYANAAGNEVELVLSDGGELVTVQGLPPEAELARIGAGFQVIGTAVAAVAAIPTTGAHLSLYNGETGTNARALVITAVGALCTVTAAVATQAVVLVRNQTPGVNANPAGAIQVWGQSGKPVNFTINAKASVVLTADSSPWIPAGLGIPPSTTTTTVAMNAHNELYGRFIVPPGGLLSLATLAATAAGSYQPYIYGYAIPLNLA